jgi:hypothetical protein
MVSREIGKRLATLVGRTSITRLALLALLGMAVLACSGRHTARTSDPKQEIAILNSWSGDLPVSALTLLPEKQRQLGTGFIGDTASFRSLWVAIDPDKPVPSVNFDLHLVVFSRNTLFYNRKRIFRVLLDDGVAEVLSSETMSSLPIENRLGIALAVIPRNGIRRLKTDGESLFVE